MLLLHFLQRLSQNQAMSKSDACQLLKGLICLQKLEMNIEKEYRLKNCEDASLTSRHRRKIKWAHEEFANRFSKVTPEERKEDLLLYEDAVAETTLALAIMQKVMEGGEQRQQRRRVMHGGDGVNTEEELADTAPAERRAKKLRCS